MKKLTFLALMLATLLTGTKSLGQAEPFLGQIALVPYQYAPNGWFKCEGQLLQINQYSALFALLGTTYGGNGTTNFALPDLRGRVPMSAGTGPGLTTRTIGEVGGSETNTLTVQQMPAHNHTVNAVSVEGNQNAPTGNLPADTKGLDKEYSNAVSNTSMNPQMIGITGGNQPVNNVQPYLTMTYIIAWQGIWPSQP